MENKNAWNRFLDFFKNHKATRRAVIAIGCVVLAAIIIVVAYNIWETPPVKADAKPSPSPVTSQALGEEDEIDDFEGAMSSGGDEGIFTFLLVGNDDGMGNTDTIMVGKLDTNNHTIDIVSIPRDTMVNISWNTKKINSVYWGTVNSGGVGIDGLKKHIKNICGFEIDCYAVIDLGAFVDIVDAIGGIDFDIPIDMDYDDPAGNIHVHQKAGITHLDGEAAMGVVRFRNNNNGTGYPIPDIGRISTQQAFIKTIANEMLTLGNIPNIGKIISIITENLDTDLSAANISFLVRQFLKCQSDNINFYTAPTLGADIYGLSYQYLDVTAWLEMVNEHLSPYSEEITTANVNILTCNYGGSEFYSTSGEFAGGYASFGDYRYLNPSKYASSAPETDESQESEGSTQVGDTDGETVTSDNAGSEAEVTPPADVSDEITDFAA